jgi:hypothetical protein
MWAMHIKYYQSLREEIVTFKSFAKWQSLCERGSGRVWSGNGPSNPLWFERAVIEEREIP